MIFAVISVFLMGVWDMQFDAMLKSKETAVASFLAERIMEECVAAGFEEAALLYPAPENIQVRSRTKSGDSITNYQVEVDVQPHPADPPPPNNDRVTVVVKVTYTDSTGPRNVQYHTVLNKYG